MTSTKTKNGYHHGDLRQALLDATVDLINERDIDAVSLRAVARRVGVTAAAPYHHFKDKNMLLAEVGQQGFEQLRDALDVAVQSVASSDPVAMMRALGTGYVGFAIGNPAHYRVMFSCDRKDEEEFPELHKSGMSCFDRLLGLSSALLGEKATEAEVGRVALTCWSACHGFATLWNEGMIGIKFEHIGVEVLLEQLLVTILYGIADTP